MLYLYKDRIQQAFDNISQSLRGFPALSTLNKCLQNSGFLWEIWWGKTITFDMKKYINIIIKQKMPVEQDPFLCPFNKK